VTVNVPSPSSGTPWPTTVSISASQFATPLPEGSTLASMPLAANTVRQTWSAAEVLAL
jgi:hypothetical protein